MLKVLIAVDGSIQSEHAVDHAIDLVRTGVPAEIVVLNVEPKPVGWQMHGLAKDATTEHLAERGEAALSVARDRLSRAGLAFRNRIELGDPAETIARIAGEEGAALIVMGSRGHGAFASLLLGSVATGVLEKADVPVTLVK